MYTELGRRVHNSIVHSEELVPAVLVTIFFQIKIVQYFNKHIKIYSSEYVFPISLSKDAAEMFGYHSVSLRI
jgi:hypothetical protein